MEGEKTLTMQTSQLYTRNGYELEYISHRLIGKVFVKSKTRFGWSKWKARWIEVRDNDILFYKYSKRKKHYKQIHILLKKYHDFTLGGLGCDGEMFILRILKNNIEKILIKTPHESAISLLYPRLEEILHVNASVGLNI